MRIQPVPIIALLLGSLFLFSCYSAVSEPPTAATTVPTTAPKAPDDRAKSTTPAKPAEQTQNPKSL